MIALAYGAETYKLKFGHRGGNHPVKNLLNGPGGNHLAEPQLRGAGIVCCGDGLEVTHVNLLDGSVEGLRCERDCVFSVQYHPESAPGPEDSGYLFDLFTENMKRFGGNRNA